MGKPSKGTPKDKRLAANKSAKQPFGGKKAQPFPKKSGGKKK
jgi:hypothetical protein